MIAFNIPWSLREAMHASQGFSGATAFILDAIRRELQRRARIAKKRAKP